jgi:hypothetical protein
VSAATVTRIVGRGMPGPMVATRTDVFDKGMDITATSLDCSYGPEDSLQQIMDDVDLVKETLSRSITPAQLLQAVKGSAGKGETVTAIPYSGLGLPGAIVVTTSSVGVYHSVYGLSGGTKLYSAGGWTTTSLSRLEALAKQAIAHL